MPETKRPLRVFLCHASGDKPAVKKLYKRLAKDGIDAWLDKEKLLPGQNWQMEIPKAVINSDVVVVCLSSQSVNKEGYVQKEIRFALDVADEKPDGTIFIIPARLENCDIPERIRRFQWVDLFSSDGYDWLLKALQLRADSIGATIKPEEKKYVAKKSNKFINASHQSSNNKSIETKALKKVITASPQEIEVQRTPWKRWVFSILIFVIFFFAGGFAGDIVYHNITGVESTGVIGAVPIWLAGVYFIYVVWNRY